MLLDNSSNHNLKTQFQSSSRKLNLYERGEKIPLLEQGIWQVKRGVVQLSHFNPQREETLLGWSQENNFFGLRWTCLETFQAKALSDVYLQWYSLIEIEQNHLLAQNILSQLIIRVQQTEKLLAIAGLKTVKSRLKELLVLLSEYLGEKRESSIRIRVRLTHQNLADAIHTTRVTVTRLLRDWQKQGLITLDEHHHLNINTQLFTY